MQQKKLFEIENIGPIRGQLELKYCGEATAGHSIDAELYARSLLGFDNSFKKIGKNLLGFEANLVVNSEQPSSFKGIIDYVLTPEGQGNISFILSLLAFLKIDITTITALPIKLFKLLIETIKKTRGRKDKFKEIFDEFELNRDAKKSLIELLNNNKFRQFLDEFTAFLDANGMEYIDIIQTEVDSVSISKKDRISFVYQPEDETLTEVDEKVVYITYLSPESSKWQFKSGKKPFWADVVDPHFLKSMQDKALEDISDLKFTALVETTTVKEAMTKRADVTRKISNFKSYTTANQLKIQL